MFDLVDLLSKNETKEDIKQEKITSVLFYQTDVCQQLVTEAYRFEGIVAPAVLENTDAKIKEFVRESSIEIVLVELNNSANVTQDAERISHLLPNHASVIVIGSEDAISTIRNLKAMGFYYLFWPITKQELIDFVRSVSENRERNKGPGQNRKAKQVSIIGSKGGVGATLLTTEISCLLATEKKASCLVVDHNYGGGNLDIVMGLKQFEKRKLQPGSLASNLDEASAQSLVTKQSTMLSILALSSDELNDQELKDYTRAVAKEVAGDANFIIEDLSASAGFTPDPKVLVTLCDSIVLVIEPSVSSLRDAAKIRSEIAKENNNSALRIITVLNYRIPPRLSTVTEKEVEKFLGQPIDIILPYEPKIDSLLLEGKRIYGTKSKMSQGVRKLTSLLLGEEVKKKKSLPISLFKKKVNS